MATPYLNVNDGKVVWPMVLVKATIDTANRELKDTLAPLQVEADAVVCHSDTEKDKAMVALTQFGVPHTVQATGLYTQAEATKVKDTFFASRSEALNYLADKEPPGQSIAVMFSQRLKNLEARLAALEG